MKKYYPVLLSKKGEIGALQYLEQSVKDNICPIIEVLQDSVEKSETKDGKTTTIDKDEFEKFLKSHWSFFNNQIILDFSYFSEVEIKIDKIKKLFTSLINAGLNVIPAIQNNSSPKYIDLIKSLMKSHRLNICIRTSERTGGVDNFKEASESLQKEMNGESNKIILLLDLGYAKPDNHNTLATNAKTVIKSLTKKVDDWLEVVVSSSSFPEDLSKFKPAHSVVHRITRYEWVIWNTIIKDDNCKNIKYSDFGTKYPFYIEANFAGSVSVKYSVKDEFVIHKGELTNEHKEGHGQYIMHAFKLITSKDYSGRGFSWGDGKIYEIAHEDLKNEKKKTGSSTTWVQISQNHHITLIDSLL